jgi:uncharacterized membrane protein YdjX (TVP38/TMEM64 family)
MKLGLLIITGIVLALLAGTLFFPASCHPADMLGYVEHAGAWGPVALGVVYIICCVFLIPGSIPTLAAGFLFGVPMGSVAAVAGSTAGACVAFQLGRTMARGWVARAVAPSRRFASLDNAIGEQGFKVVLLTRLSPISPFIVLNYLLGLTKVPFRDYLLGSVIGMIPGTVLFVYIGAGLRSLAGVTAYGKARIPATPAEHVFFWAGLVVTVIVSVVLARVAQRALQRPGQPSA